MSCEYLREVSTPDFLRCLFTILAASLHSCANLLKTMTAVSENASAPDLTDGVYSPIRGFTSIGPSSLYDESAS